MSVTLWKVLNTQRFKLLASRRKVKDSEINQLRYLLQVKIGKYLGTNVRFKDFINIQMLTSMFHAYIFTHLQVH